MGHLAGKDVYRRLGKKIDGLQTRSPWTPALRAILKELYSEEEAALIVALPYAPATLDRIAAVTGQERSGLERTLEALCQKGLVIDIWSAETSTKKYVASPMMSGIFEFAMMRTSTDEELRKRARLFHDYLASGAFYAANMGDGQEVFIGRALPHEDTLLPSSHAEILDYERAATIIEQNDRYSIGICACRHEKLHAGQKSCDTPLSTCTSFGTAADYLIRHDFARPATREELLENLARARELGLVLNADNVQHNLTFLCHCCGCCCNMLLGITRHGYTGTIASSNYVARADPVECKGCGNCQKACPVDCIELSSPRPDAPKRLRRPSVDETRCLGCGVCATRCPTGAMRLAPRERRVFHPSNTFERVILQSLERGTLQNLIFDNPQSQSQGFMRALVGGFLRLTPVKQALMSRALRSTFLAWLSGTARRRGHEDITRM